MHLTGRCVCVGGACACGHERLAQGTAGMGQLGATEFCSSRRDEEKEQGGLEEIKWRMGEGRRDGVEE